MHKGGTYVCMEGPQFSTLAESKLYRSWGMDIIGMTNLQEAKLAREAEICYTTIALVTDYDCWHPEHDQVTVEMIIANLTQNAKMAQQVIAGAVAALPSSARASARQRSSTRSSPGPTPCPPRSSGSWRRLWGNICLALSRQLISCQLGRRHLIQLHELRGWRAEIYNMSIVVTGSIAFDYLMSFPGKFTEHFLPEHMSRVSLSFLVDTMDKRRGGCAPNIAYTLALLGERPRLMATAGQDFDDYRRWLEAAGVDTSLVREVLGKFTASFFCSTDTENNQIASFYTGAMANAGELSFRDVDDCRLAIISPNDPAAMMQYAEECRTLGIPFIWDPGQQCARMSGPELQDGFEGSALVICNDYEFELIRQKTSVDERPMLEHTEALVITRGEAGCSIYTKAGRKDVPAVPPTRIVDPTGVGDAFRAGYLKGLSRRADHEVCARMGAVAATYALEHLGGQSHAFTWAEFHARYEAHFGPTGVKS